MHPFLQYFNYKLILRIGGGLAVFLGLVLIVPLIFAWLWEESISAFLIPAVIFLCLGIFVSFRMRPEKTSLKIRDGFLLGVFCWVLMSILGGVPYVLAGAADPISAFFESASGFTTTGASILENLEDLPRSLLLWRSLTGFIGGLSILYFAVALFPGLNIGAHRLFDAAYRVSAQEQLNAKAKGIMLSVGSFYGLLTLVEVLALKGVGLSWFDAVIHSMGTVSTTGFSNYTDGLMHFSSSWPEIIICLFMILAGGNFIICLGRPRYQRSNPLREPETKAYMGIIVFASIFMSLTLWIYGVWVTPGDAFLNGFVQTISIVSTTGYLSGSFTAWPTCCRIVFLVLMFAGACSGSTGGGLKILRAMALGKLMRGGIYRRLHPRAVTPLKIGKKVISPEATAAITGYLFLYIVFFVACSLILCLETGDMVTAAGASLACIGNIGPGFQVLGTALNFADFSGISQIFLGLVMIAGRLEIFALLLLLMPSFWNPDK